MATMNVPLPDAMKDWVEGQTQSGRYSNASDYVRDLIRRDQERANKIAAMQRLIDEAEEGGVSAKGVHQIFDEAMARNKKN
ncbi:MAG: type II toxin-antitoxin system ParD family antitoxin [Methylocystis sp.]